MAAIISWEQLLVPQRLPSGDLIRLTMSWQVPLNSSNVEFQLVTAPRITSLKRIRIFDARGQIAILQTGGSIHQTTQARFSTDGFNRGGLRVELVKAMAFGIATGVYELINVGQWKGQSLRFEWLED